MQAKTTSTTIEQDKPLLDDRLVAVVDDEFITNEEPSQERNLSKIVTTICLVLTLLGIVIIPTTFFVIKGGSTKKSTNQTYAPHKVNETHPLKSPSLAPTSPASIPSKYPSNNPTTPPTLTINPSIKPTSACGPSNCANMNFRASSNKDFCLNLPNGFTQDGQKLDLAPCNGSPAQTWTIDTKGYIHSNVNNGKCIDADGEGFVRIWSCKYKYLRQMWFVTLQGEIRTYSSYNTCMFLNGGSMDNMNMQLKICDLNDSQKWIFSEQLVPSMLPTEIPSLPPTITPTVSNNPSMRPSDPPTFKPSLSIQPTLVPTSSDYYQVITQSKGWRIWTNKYHTQAGWAWDLAELQFFSTVDCGGTPIDPTAGTPINSGNAGQESWGPENAFTSYGTWGGTPLNDAFWLGKMFDNNVQVRCIKIRNANYAEKAAKEVRIQAYNEEEDRWQNAWVEKNLDVVPNSVSVIKIIYGVA